MLSISNSLVYEYMFKICAKYVQNKIVYRLYRSKTNYLNIYSYTKPLEILSIINFFLYNKCSIRTLRELIDVRDGYSECIGFTSDEIDEFILALCTG